MRIRLGTRGSRLALIQSELVARRLREAGHDVELVPIVTEGDLRPPGMIPGEGVFVAAIAHALLAGAVDVAVHSAKDVPLVEDRGLVIAAYPERADPRDALVTKAGNRALDTLDADSTVGTDSPRRTGFVLAARPDLRVVPVHGNVDTRLRKLDNGDVDALVIAAAGLERLGQAGRIDERLEPSVVAPAPGQGALAVQARRSDVELLRILEAMDSREIHLAVEIEREVLSASGGTCRAPIGALVAVDGDRCSLLAAGVRADGTDRRVDVLDVPIADARGAAAEAGRALAEVVRE
jgi:hydroxymethylbilane synthase